MSNTYGEPPILLNPLFLKISSTSPNPALFCFSSLDECVIMPLLMYQFALWQYGPKLVKPWYLSTISTFLCVYLLTHETYRWLSADDIVFAITMTCYHTKWQTHRNTIINRLTHTHKNTHTYTHTHTHTHTHKLLTRIKKQLRAPKCWLILIMIFLCYHTMIKISF